MKYYSEISKIVEGALNSNPKKVVAYVNMLADKLAKDGEERASQNILKKIDGIATNNIKPQALFQKPIPVESDSRFALADKTSPNLKLSDVVLKKRVSEKINLFIKYIKDSDLLKDAGVPINPTLLIHGMPGTGKSKLASLVASQLGLPLITSRSDALISSYLGATSKNIRSLIDYAREQPCVLFLDEFDSIAKARDDRNEIGELKRVVVSLLQNIDTLSDTVLIAATNHPHLLDPAIGRRFHYNVEMTPPDEEERKDLFSLFLKNFAKEKQIKDFAKASQGLTGAEIEILVNESLRETIIAGSSHIDEDKIIKGIISFQYTALTFERSNMEEELAFLRNQDPSLFSYRRLANIYQISHSQVSKLIKHKEMINE
jgi:AAA+ superfamily predicted ATPase